MSESLFRETPWETRNLGLPSFALSDESASLPSKELLSKGLADLSKAHKTYFAMARATKHEMALSESLSALGFYVVECAVSPTTNLKRNPVMARFEEDSCLFIPQKYKDAPFQILTMDHNSELPIEELKAMAAGSFIDDRFHVDHNCPDDVADRRFSFWIDDLFANPEVTFDLLKLDNSLIAFMARKGNNLILAGFHATYRNAGLGDYFWLSSCKMVKDEGVASVHTQISINNLSVLNLYGRLGFKFKDAQYIYHLWHK